MNITYRLHDGGIWQWANVPTGWLATLAELLNADHGTYITADTHPRQLPALRQRPRLPGRPHRHGRGDRAVTTETRVRPYPPSKAAGGPTHLPASEEVACSPELRQPKEGPPVNPRRTSHIKAGIDFAGTAALGACMASAGWVMALYPDSPASFTAILGAAVTCLAVDLGATTLVNHLAKRSSR